MSRRRQPTTTSSQATASTSRATNSVSLDHNYGEPGPSSSLRNSRRVPTLSRHQRPADELDTPIDELSSTPAEDPLRLPERVSQRLRDRPQTNAISSTSRSLNSRRNRVDYEEPATSDEEEEEIEASVEEDSEQANESSDTDDDKPLGHLVASQESQRPLRAARSGRSQEAVGTSARSTRVSGQKRPYYNEQSDDESINGRNGEQVFSTPAVKRRRGVYREDSEEEDPDDNERLNSESQKRTPRARNGATHTNGRNHYNEEESVDEDSDADNGEPKISVSSRGRVRRISNRAKNYFRDRD